VSEIKQTEKNDVDYEKEVRLLEEMYFEKLQHFGGRGYNKPPKK
jgi:hypothetical protein